MPDSPDKLTTEEDRRFGLIFIVACVVFVAVGLMVTPIAQWDYLKKHPMPSDSIESIAPSKTSQAIVSYSPLPPVSAQTQVFISQRLESMLNYKPAPGYEKGMVMMELTVNPDGEITKKKLIRRPRQNESNLSTEVGDVPALTALDNLKKIELGGLILNRPIDFNLIVDGHGFPASALNVRAAPSLHIPIKVERVH